MNSAYLMLNAFRLVLCPRRNFTALDLAGFQRLMNSVKRGDIVGITGSPGKSKRGELSIFPSAMQVGGRVAGWLAGWSRIESCRRES